MSATLATALPEIERDVDLPRVVRVRRGANSFLDRRVGERRKLLAPLSGSWVTTRSTEETSWSAVEPIELLEVSPTGIAFAAETVASFRVGSHTAVAFDQLDAIVTLCRVTQLDPTRSLYAARVVNPGQELLEFLGSLECDADYRST